MLEANVQEILQSFLEVDFIEKICYQYIYFFIRFFMNFLKSKIFWGVFIILFLIVAYPTTRSIIDIYVYHPKPDIKEEDYFILPDDPPIRLKPMPKEDLEVTLREGKQIVDAKKDGYQLILDPDFEIVTREIETGRVMIYKDKCRATIIKMDQTENINIPQWFEKDKENLAWQNSIGVNLLTIKDYYIKKIDHPKLDAYYSFLDSEEFGLEKEILIQGKNGIFSISQSNKQKDCFSLDEVFKGFQLTEK